MKNIHMYLLFQFLPIDPFELLHSGPLNAPSCLFIYLFILHLLIYFCGGFFWQTDLHSPILCEY